MKRIGLILGGLIALAVIIVVVAPFLIPASQYKARIEAAASDATGRAFTISGPMHFTLWPSLGVTVQNVTIANAKGGVAPFLASIGELDIGVAASALLKGEVQVTRLILKTPNLALEEDVAGKPNWIFEAKPQTANAQKSPALKQLGLGDVRITDGALSYRDKLGKVQAISALNATASLKDLDQPFHVAGDFNYNNDKTSVTLDLAKPRALLDKGQTPMTLAAKAAKLDFAIDGVFNAATTGIAGKVRASGPSLRQLSAWTGNPIGSGGGLGPFSVAGNFKMEGPRTDLNAVTFTLDAAKGQGDLEIVTAPAGKAPLYVSGALTLAALDLNTYLGAGAQTTPNAPAAAKGVDVGAPWGNAPINMSGLKAINADLKLKTGPLTFQKMKVDAAAIDLALKDGVMKAALNNLTLYGGAGTGALTLDGTGAGLRLADHLSVRGVSAQPFLTDAVGFKNIEGKADVDIDIAGAGATQQSLVNTLSGSAKFAFKDGALRGVNLAQVARQIQSVLTGAALGAAAKTDFAEMGATFKIANGVATTTDGHMLNPFVRITSAGQIDLAHQSILMKVTTRLVKSPQGQGGKADMTGLTVPFTVKGPWSKLGFSPDLGGVLQDQIQTQMDKALGGKGIAGLFGAKKSADGSTPPADNPLSQLLKKAH